MIQLFTDGACSGNPGAGGYAVILRSGIHYKELSGGFRKTTNNRMELMAVIKGLEAIRKTKQVVTIFSDSRYIVNAVEKKWLWGWVKKGFKGKKNKDLWLHFLNLYQLHEIYFTWIKGHNKHPENERCDHLAIAAYQQNNLLIDTIFEQEWEQRCMAHQLLKHVSQFHALNN